MRLNVETIIGNVSEVFRLPAEEQKGLKLELLRQNFAHHYEKNSFFRAQCEQIGLDAYDLEEFQDLARIPLIPMRNFKSPSSHVLLSIPLTDVELEIKSTGTSGIPSVARRDAKTLDRVTMGLVGLYRDFFRISRGAGLFLAPTLAESPEMGMVKVLNIFCGFLTDYSFLVQDYSFYPEDAVKYLERWEGKEVRHIFGPPFLVNRLLRYLEEENLRLQLDPESLIITIGGWKKFSGEFIGREELNQKVEHYLGLPAHRLRDMYGMTESNMLAIECEHHNKHVAPWCYVSIRKIDNTAQEVAPGEEGAIALLDPISLSYPAYILSEDVGAIVGEDRCACGRSGQVVTFYRRLDGSEYGCCAVSLEKFIESQELTRSCEVR